MRTSLDHRAERGRHRDDAGREWDLRLCELRRITGAVPAFLVVANCGPQAVQPGNPLDDSAPFPVSRPRRLATASTYPEIWPEYVAPNGSFVAIESDSMPITARYVLRSSTCSRVFSNTAPA